MLAGLSTKLAAWTAAEARFDEVRERWDDVVAPRLRQLVRPLGTIREILRRAGHPLSFDELDPPIPPSRRVSRSTTPT